MGSFCSADVTLVQSSLVWSVGPVPLGPVPVGGLLVPVGLVLVGPVLVGPVPASPVLVGPEAGPEPHPPDQSPKDFPVNLGLIYRANLKGKIKDQGSRIKEGPRIKDQRPRILAQETRIEDKDR